MFDVLFILSALMNYKKYERTNLYITRASTFAQRQPLESLVETISEVLSECNRYGLSDASSFAIVVDTIGVIRRYRLAMSPQPTNIVSMLSDFFSNLVAKDTVKPENEPM